jgi:recombination protein RecA
VRAKVVKNKVAPPFHSAEFDILYDQGISKSNCILDMAVARNILQKSGTWFLYGQDKIGQGKENARRFLEENPKLLKELETKVRSEVSVAP